MGMAAPEFVPQKPAQRVRNYQSPPRRNDSWTADRPGDLTGEQPRGELLGSPGPDQGFMLKLARKFEGELVLNTGEHERDALAGCVAVGLRRASLFGRAPVIHDLTHALTIWGYLDEAPRELVELRKELFEEVAHEHHYAELRKLVDMVPEATLLLPHTAVYAGQWRDLLGVG